MLLLLGGLNLPFFTPYCQILVTVRDLYGEGEGRGGRFEKDAPVNEFSDWLLLTLGARDFSSAVSGFCQAYGRRCVGLRLTTQIPTAREKKLWYPG